MKYSTTSHFDRAFGKSPAEVQRALRKQIGYLLVDIRHPSLRAKKYDATDVWQAPCLSKSKAIGYKQQSREVGHELQAMSDCISGLRAIHTGY